MTHEAGKGDKQRPTDYEKFNANFEKIFGKPSGITEQEFNNVDENFAKAHAQYRKDMECLKENPSD
jgi:hypothetical protein